jgi:hypothetical protein
LNKTNDLLTAIGNLWITSPFGGHYPTITVWRKDEITRRKIRLPAKAGADKRKEE